MSKRLISHNKLTFIKPIDIKSKYRCKMALYKCECGNEKELIIDNVNKNHTKSCGCLQNKKKVIQRCKFCSKEGHYKIRCPELNKYKKCTQCKQTFDISEFLVHDRRSGAEVPYRKPMCRICWNEKCKNKHVTNLRHRLGNMLASAKHRVKTTNLEFNIDLNFLNDLYNKQKAKCVYSGQPLSLEKGDNGISLDKINAKLGYTKDNVVFTTWKINQMKKHYSKEIFIETCKNIADYARENDV